MLVLVLVLLLVLIAHRNVGRVARTNVFEAMCWVRY